MEVNGGVGHGQQIRIRYEILMIRREPGRRGGEATLVRRINRAALPRRGGYSMMGELLRCRTSFAKICFRSVRHLRYYWDEEREAP